MRTLTRLARRCGLGAAMLGVTGYHASAQRSSGTTDEAGVRVAVEAYFDGITNNDAEALDRAFAPQGRIMFVRSDGTLYERSFEEWAMFAERPPAPEGKENHLVSVDVTGTAAMAKTELFWPGVHYVDYLSLLRMDGEWRIVQKIWWQESR